MFEIDSAGATASNTFTDGDPATATPATIVSAEWLNSVQAELVAIVEGFGGTLDKATTNQIYTLLAAALSNGSTSFAGVLALLDSSGFTTGTDSSKALTASLFARAAAQPGYMKLPGGVILQWGYSTIPANSPGLTVTLPIALSQPLFTVMLGGNAAAPIINTYRLPTAVDFILQAWDVGGGVYGSTSYCSWMVVGKL